LESQWREAGTERGRPYPYETIKVEGAADVVRKMRPAPGVVIFSGTGSESISIYSQLQKDTRLGELIFAGPATIMSNGFSSGLPSGIQGSLYAVTPVPFDDSTPGITDFQALYQAQYTDPNPTPYSAAAYDATRALIVSVRAAISDGARPAAVGHGPIVGSIARTLREATLVKLSALNSGAGSPQYRQAATGTFSFTDKGDADYGGNVPPTTIYRYLDEKTAEKLKEPRTGWRVSQPR
jgi:ABC-type branched-subunit amino acid transport system substrate-binding protein